MLTFNDLLDLNIREPKEINLLIDGTPVTDYKLIVKDGKWKLELITLEPEWDEELDCCSLFDILEELNNTLEGNVDISIRDVGIEHENSGKELTTMHLSDKDIIFCVD